MRGHSKVVMSVERLGMRRRALWVPRGAPVPLSRPRPPLLSCRDNERSIEDGLCTWACCSLPLLHRISTT